MSTETLLSGADAYTPLVELSSGPDSDTPAYTPWLVTVPMPSTTAIIGC